MSSRAISAQYGVACPTCDAASDQPCRTLRTGRVTDTHRPRIDLWLWRRARDVHMAWASDSSAGVDPTPTDDTNGPQNGAQRFEETR